MRHILWINEYAHLLGGCEQYIYNTVNLLKQRGVRSTFLYDAITGLASPEMLRAFDGAYPLVDPARQVAEIAPNLIYVHRLTGRESLLRLAATGIPVVRFFHDHKLFCLREHKYKTVSRITCTKPIGFRCYPCLGFVKRGTGRLGLRFSTVAALRRELRANLGLDAFVTGSHYMAEHVAAHGFDRGRIHVLPLYAMPPEPNPEIERQRNLLLFAGQLIRGKGLDVLLKALKLAPRPVRLAVVGTGRQEGLYRAMTASLGLDGRVSFKGPLAGRDVAAYYQRATCVVVPSRAPETFGLIGPEAMSYGTPVIASAVGGTGEWLEDGQTGFAVSPNDPTALAQAIDRLVGDEALAARMGETARRRYDERFRPEHHVEALIKLYDTLVKETAGS